MIEETEFTKLIRKNLDARAISNKVDELREAPSGYSEELHFKEYSVVVSVEENDYDGNTLINVKIIRKGIDDAGTN